MAKLVPVLIIALLLPSLACGAEPLAEPVIEAINVARLIEGVPPVAQDDVLAFAAAIEADWHGYANRHNKVFQYHAVDTAWLLKNYPKLLWSRLRETFPGGLPPSLSAHNVARLCGWERGFVLDIEGEARASRLEDLVVGWDRSDYHSLVLYNVIADFDVCGVASEPRGGGKQICVAVFGVSIQE